MQLGGAIVSSSEAFTINQLVAIFTLRSYLHVLALTVMDRAGCSRFNSTGFIGTIAARVHEFFDHRMARRRELRRLGSDRSLGDFTRT